LATATFVLSSGFSRSPGRKVGPDENPVAGSDQNPVPQDPGPDGVVTLATATTSPPQSPSLVLEVSVPTWG
jgi:hypothetical protein